MESDTDEIGSSKIKQREFPEKCKLHSDEKKLVQFENRKDTEEYTEFENKFRNLNLLEPDSVPLSDELNTDSTIVDNRSRFLETERFECKQERKEDSSQENDFQQHDNNIEISKSASSQDVADLQQGDKNQSQIVKEASFVFRNELKVDVTDYRDSLYWDTKYCSELVNLVAIFYYRKYHILPRWNPSNYDCFPQNPNVQFTMTDAEHVERVLKCKQHYYEGIFFSLFDPRLRIDQYMFDAAVNVVLEEHMHQYYILMRAFELATAIAIFAIHSSQRGFLDALYHAVHSIVTNVKILRTCIRNPSNNLLKIFQRNTPNRSQRSNMPRSGPRAVFLRKRRNKQKKSAKMK